MQQVEPSRRHRFPTWLRLALNAVGLLAIGLVVLFAVWRWNLTCQNNRKLAAIRAAGFPTNWKELNAYYPPVPVDKNAAPVMEEAFKLLREYPDERDEEVRSLIRVRGARSVEFSPEEQEMLAEYVRMNEAAIAIVREALKRPRCRYPVDFSQGDEPDFPHLPPLKKLGEISLGQVLLATDSDASTNEIPSITTILGLARTLDEEPDLISWLVRRALHRMAEAGLERVLGKTSIPERELIALQNEFTDAEKTNALLRVLAAQRALPIPAFRMSVDDLNILAYGKANPSLRTTAQTMVLRLRGIS